MWGDSAIDAGDRPSQSGGRVGCGPHKDLDEVVANAAQAVLSTILTVPRHRVPAPHGAHPQRTFGRAANDRTPSPREAQ